MREVSLVSEDDSTNATHTNIAEPVVNAKPFAARSNATLVSAASLRLMSDPQPMRVGERRQLKLLLKTDAPLGLVALSLRLDPRVLAVRSVSGGTLYAPTEARLTHTFTTEGLLLVSVAPNSGAEAISGAGVLIVVEVEAVADGAGDLSFGAEDVHLVATDGRKIILKVLTDQVAVGR
jgi:hypothetical protein